MYRASVIIPHHNDPGRLYRCLYWLSVCEMIEECEVIVIDNGSPALDPAAHWPCANLSLLRTHQKGAAHARNFGAEAANSDALLFLDCDCVPEKNFIRAALNALESNPIVGGEVSLFDETQGPRTGAQAFETVFAFNQHDYIHRKGFSVTANLAVRASVFEKIGPFRNAVSEDFDWCQRARSKGFEISHEPRMSVRHPTRSSWVALRRKWARVSREMRLLRHPELSWALRTLLLPASVAYHLPRIYRSKALTTSRERWRASITLARLRLWRFRIALRPARLLNN